MAECPIAYDHNDNLDECAVCGWTPVPTVLHRERPSRSNMTGPQRIQEATDRLSGAYSPTTRITLCDNRVTT